MAKIQARILKGFRDYLPEDMLARRSMLEQVEAVFRKFGFAPIDTPALEYTDILLGKYGEEGEKLLYRFEDNGGRDVALRYDLTVPLARLVAMNGNLLMPFKRYHIGPVWRAEKPGRGRFREFSQCDADIIGAPGAAAEVDILSVGMAILDGLDVHEFTLHVNHRGVFDGLLDGLGLVEQGTRAHVVRTIDKLDKIGREKVLNLLRDEVELDEQGLETVSGFLDIPAGDIAAAELFFASMPKAKTAIESLKETFELAEKAGIGERLHANFAVARGLDYYTGLIYETTLNSLPDMGSVMSGGRYDGITDMFGAAAHPAVGISLGVDRLFAALKELGALELASTPSQVLVAVFNEEHLADSFKIAQTLRSKGIHTEVFLGESYKLKKQFRYADRMGIPFIAIQGPDERDDGVVTLRRLSDGTEAKLPVEAIPDHIKD
jgi:histidyl-tRNA synthetase